MRSFSNPLRGGDFASARKRLLQMHFEAGVGHIGGNLSAIDALLVLFHEYLTGDDSFILSKGHSAGALYTVLWSVGALSEDDLRTFHVDDTRLAGHPPASGVPSVLFATGSLGHGLSLAAGTALGFRFRERRGRVYCLLSDGEWQEGATWEALIFAAHHRLDALTVLVDHNRLQGLGTTAEVASMAPLWEKLAGFDVEVEVVDGHDPSALRGVLGRRCDRPRVVCLETTKGKGVTFMERGLKWHYLPLDEEQYRRAVADLGAG